MRAASRPSPAQHRLLAKLAQPGAEVRPPWFSEGAGRMRGRLLLPGQVYGEVVDTNTFNALRKRGWVGLVDPGATGLHRRYRLTELGRATLEEMERTWAS